MDSHPLFDERVVDLLRGVTDELVKVIPDEISAIDLVLRPGPRGREIETTLSASYPDAPPPTDWSVPESVADACRNLVAAWIAMGHAMPAFKFSHTRDADGNWKASMEPLLEW